MWHVQKSNVLKDHTGDTGRHLIEHMKNYCGKDANLHLFTQAIPIKHKAVSLEYFEIIGIGYKKSKNLVVKLAKSL